jgi:hypothetical protein
MTMPVVTLPNGISVLPRTEPPEGFDPLTASAADLKRYGFPPRHDENPRLLAEWRKFFGGRPKYVTPEVQFMARERKGPRFKPQRGAKATHGKETAGWWAGGIVYFPATPTEYICEVLAYYNVPNLQPGRRLDQQYNASCWVGIDDGDDLIQAGVECEITFADDGTTTTNFYPWWEWVPGGMGRVYNVTVSPGDAVSVDVAVDPATKNTATIWFVNRTNSQWTSQPVTAPAGTTVSGGCAEWIVESTDVGNSTYYLAHFDPVTFTMCNALTVSKTVLHADNGDTMDMVDSRTGAQKATANLSGHDTINVQYVWNEPDPDR